MAKKYWNPVFSAAAFWIAGAGCVQRTLTVNTDPPGALVYMNDQEIGRTPLTKPFTWYGVYDVEIQKPGYQSIRTTTPVIAPWWQWIPFDFFAEFFPLTDHHEISFTLRLPDERNEEADLMVKRGNDFGTQLDSSRKPATQPTTKPHEHKKPKEKPATQK